MAGTEVLKIGRGPVCLFTTKWSVRFELVSSANVEGEVYGAQDDWPVAEAAEDGFVLADADFGADHAGALLIVVAFGQDLACR